MILHAAINDAALRKLIKGRLICWGGNKKLAIYGRLHCKTGKRMKRQNRVFFQSEEEALQNNYRPCGHCMNDAYKKWKDGLIQ